MSSLARQSETAPDTREHRRRQKQTFGQMWVERGHTAVEGAVKAYASPSQYRHIYIHAAKLGWGPYRVTVAMTSEAVLEIQKAIQLVCWEAIAPYSSDIEYKFERIFGIERCDLADGFCYACSCAMLPA
jgi:hypothetical protein